MRAVSWNVNGLRACMGKGFEESFEKLNADIFCLQETKLQEGQIELKLPDIYSGTESYTAREPVDVIPGANVRTLSESVADVRNHLHKRPCNNEVGTVLQTHRELHEAHVEFILVLNYLVLQGSVLLNIQELRLDNYARSQMELVENTGLESDVVLELEVFFCNIRKVSGVDTCLYTELGGGFLWSSHEHERKRQCRNCKLGRLFHIYVFLVKAMP